jgi:hypothetical protein
MIESALSPKEQIDILTKEYNSLRTEVMQRTTSIYQLLGVGVTVSVAISVLGAAYSPKTAAVAFTFFAIIIAVLFRNVEFHINELATRLRELEQAINELAGTTLLEWETKRGGILPDSRRRRVDYVFGPFLKVYRRLINRSHSN